MNTLKLFGLFFFVTSLFISCEEEDPGTPKQSTQTYEYSQILRGSKDIEGTISNFTPITLVGIIGSDAAKNFKSGELQLANCYFEIDGLDAITVAEGETAILKNFTIQVGTRTPFLLGDCKVDPQSSSEFASDTRQSTNKFISVINDIFTDLTTGSKTALLKASFTPTFDIATADNVTLKIVIGGTYYYTVFE